MSTLRVLSLVALALLCVAVPSPSRARDSQPGPRGAIFPAADHDPTALGGGRRDRCRLEDGSWIVVDVEKEPSGADNLVVRRFDADGSPVGAPLRPNTEPVARLRQLACNTRGDFVVAWTDEASGMDRMRVHARNGRALSPETRAAADDYLAWHSDIVGLAISGDRRVVAVLDQWLDRRTDLVVRAEDGGLLGSHEGFLGDSWTDFAALDIDGGGNVLVASGRQLRMLGELRSGGRPFGAAFPVRTTDGVEATVLQVKALAPGVFLPMWFEFASGWLSVLVTHDEQTLVAPPVVDAERDATFARSLTVAGPVTLDLAAYHEVVEKGRLWPLAGHLAKGDGAWVMARSHPTWRGAGWGGGSSDFSWDAALQRSVDGGRSWGDRKQLRQFASPGDGLSSIPDIAGDGRGHFVAVWLDDLRDQPLYSVQLSAVSSVDDGANWSAPLAVHREVESRERGVPFAGPVRVATDGRGAWLAAWGVTTWNYEARRSDNKLLASLSTDDGANWTEAREIAVDRGYGLQGLDVEWDGDGRWVVAWSDDVLRTSDSEDGERWSEPAVLTPVDVPQAVREASLYGEASPGIRHDVSLAADGSGRLLLVAVAHALDGDRFGVDDDVFAWTKEGGDRGWSPPSPVASYATTDGTDDEAPVVASDGRGGWIAAWHAVPGSSAGLDGDVLLSRSSDGCSWGAATTVPVSDGPDRGSDYPGDIVTSGGVSMLSWGTSGEAWATGVVIAGDTCGDGRLDSGEACDDGNAADGDSCNATCSAPRCGNGARDPGEECDDGNEDGDDACTPSCTASRCGDGYVQPASEQCDDGNASSKDACVPGCLLATCGDGFVEAGVEDCDAGGGDDDWNGACPQCRTARCGDGFVRTGVEECDDGNTDENDECTNDCTVARCGDGVVLAEGYLQEACDPAAAPLGDWCTDACSMARCPDADGSGGVTTHDAIRIVAHAVGIANSCPLAACDVNSNRRIDVLDARLALRRAVGIDGDAICEAWKDIPAGLATVTFSIDDPRPLADLQVRVSYETHSDRFDPFGLGTPVCETDVEGATRAFESEPGNLVATMLMPDGITGKNTLFHCSWYGVHVPVPAEFSVTAKDAADPDGKALDPLPNVIVRVE